MRKLLGAIAATAMLCAASLSANAATLTGGTLQIQISALPGLVINQNPASVSVTVAADGSFTVPANIFQTFKVLDPNLFTGVPLIDSLTISAANKSGTFSKGGAAEFKNGVFMNGNGFGGSLAISGKSIVGVLGGLINLNVPFANVGNGGAAVMTGAAALKITVTGAQWTTGKAQIKGVTFNTAGGNEVTKGTVTVSGGRQTTAGGKINLTLVTPLRILTNAAGNLPAFNVMKLTLVPEPGTLLLVGAGIGGLVIVGRRRFKS